MASGNVLSDRSSAQYFLMTSRGVGGGRSKRRIFAYVMADS